MRRKEIPFIEIITIAAGRRECRKIKSSSVTLIGIVAGLAGALSLTHLMSSLLFGVSASDPITFATVAALLMVVALGACYFPARRASSVEPMVALRGE